MLYSAYENPAHSSDSNQMTHEDKLQYAIAAIEFLADDESVSHEQVKSLLERVIQQTRVMMEGL